MANIHELVSIIGETQHYFKLQASRQVDTALTLRNWLFGYYIAEYELNGADRAEYGQKLFKEIAKRTKHIKGMSESNLYLFKQFYLSYPQIFQSLTGKSYLIGFQDHVILRTVSAKLISITDGSIESDQLPKIQKFQSPTGISQIDIEKLINQLSFTHIIELLKADTPLKRSFYEKEAVTNCWSVRELQRAMNSMLYERTGLSTNKQSVIEKQVNQERLSPEDVFRNPYILEFLGLPQEAELQKIIEEEQRKITPKN